MIAFLGDTYQKYHEEICEQGGWHKRECRNTVLSSHFIKKGRICNEAENTIRLPVQYAGTLAGCCHNASPAWCYCILETKHGLVSCKNEPLRSPQCSSECQWEFDLAQWPHHAGHTECVR